MDNSGTDRNVTKQSVKWRYYCVTFFPPKDSIQRSKIAKDLASQGGVRLHSSLWKIPSQNMRQALKALLGYGPTVFKRSREIFPPEINFNKKIFDLGSVSIISYRLPKTSSRERTAVLRILRRVPKIKIGSSLLIVPCLKSSRLNTYNGRVVLQDELFNFLDREGIEAHRLAHLRIVYPSSQEGLLKTMISHEVLLCENMAISIKCLTYVIKHSENYDLIRLKKDLSFYRSRYRDLQGIIYFLYTSMNIDLRPDLRKVYNMLIHYRRAIEDKVEQLSIAE